MNQFLIPIVITVIITAIITTVIIFYSKVFQRTNPNPNTIGITYNTSDADTLKIMFAINNVLTQIKETICSTGNFKLAMDMINSLPDKSTNETCSEDITFFTELVKESKPLKGETLIQNALINLFTTLVNVTCINNKPDNAKLKLLMVNILKAVCSQR